jgi:hypothetical protein
MLKLIIHCLTLSALIEMTHSENGSVLLLSPEFILRQKKKKKAFMGQGK